MFTKENIDERKNYIKIVHKFEVVGFRSISIFHRNEKLTTAEHNEYVQKVNW